jgi:hypothetical protein
MASFDIRTRSDLFQKRHCCEHFSDLSFNADDQTRETGATLLLQGHDGLSAPLPHENEVIGIEGVPVSFPLTAAL